jgi:hypothetical protein
MWCSGQTPCIHWQQDQCPRVLGHRLTAEAPVKRIRFGVEGMGQQRADACMLGNGDGAPDRILKETDTQAALLVIEITASLARMISGIGYWPIPRLAANTYARVAAGHRFP